MASFPPFLVTERQAAGSDPAGDAGPLFVARWELDLTPAHGLVESLAGGGAPPPNWVETLLHGALITDHDDHAAQVVVAHGEVLGYLRDARDQEGVDAVQALARELTV